MKVWRGYSLETAAGVAVAQAILGGDVAAAPPDLLIAFTWTKQDPAPIAAGLAERFPRTLVIGSASRRCSSTASPAPRGPPASPVAAPRSTAAPAG